MTKVEIMRRKLYLAEKEAEGQVLMAEEELRTDYSREEKEGIGPTYFMGYHSESTEDENEDKGGKAKVCCTTLESNMLKIMDGLLEQKSIISKHQKIVEQLEQE